MLKLNGVMFQAASICENCSLPMPGKTPMKRNIPQKKQCVVGCDRWIKYIYIYIYTDICKPSARFAYIRKLLVMFVYVEVLILNMSGVVSN